MLCKRLLVEKGMLEKVCMEVRMLRTLEHPQVVQLYEVRDSANDIFLVCSFVLLLRPRPAASPPSLVHHSSSLHIQHTPECVRLHNTSFPRNREMHGNPETQSNSVKDLLLPRRGVPIPIHGNMDAILGRALCCNTGFSFVRAFNVHRPLWS